MQDLIARYSYTVPVELPRVEIIHDLPEDQRCCSEGHALKVNRIRPWILSRLLDSFIHYFNGLCGIYGV
jgi:hypothetical protein